MEVDVYTIDDKDYILIDKVKNFLYLSAEDNDENILICKTSDDNPETILSLDDDEEFEQALMLLTTKKLEEEN